QNICAGSSYNFNGVILSAAGSYYDTLTAVSGCDSIVTLNLMVNAVSAVTVFQTICSGDIYWFGGDSLSQAGVYRDSLQSIYGCDSIVTLFLIVHQRPQATIILAADTMYTQTYISYQWLQNGQAIGGATAQSLVLSQNGTYSVVVTDSSGCSDTSASISITHLGIPAIGSVLDVQLYPNPSTALIHLSMSKPAMAIAIYDMEGRIVYKINTSEVEKDIDLNWLAKGCYNVDIIFDSGTYRRRLILE
ncbi:MAG: T9SS type A sorting domain-containing protein, partial [Bacteroidetes bacterium]|nr:T9SS type A sorting domain-containing protein [Bacteroidota bacterium]